MIMWIIDYCCCRSFCFLKCFKIDQDQQTKLIIKCFYTRSGIIRITTYCRCLTIWSATIAQMENDCTHKKIIKTTITLTWNQTRRHPAVPTPPTNTRCHRYVHCGRNTDSSGKPTLMLLN